MIADPLAILEEGEVHICFSTPFDRELMLHDVDLLVARLPAVLPSDVQKVRAVFKPALKAYRDVIVFPSKGPQCLASLLSGGDYDGDRAWICWEPSIVDPFRNAPVPSSPPRLSSYGIEIDTTTVSDLFLRKPPDDSYIDRFLYHGFSFNLQSDLLGICTSYFESLCYSHNSISHPSAIRIAHLLGQLVDRAKAGIIFNEKTWDTFLRAEGLPRKLAKPAYKDKERGVYDKRKGHLIDRLVFETAKGIRQRVLHDFSKRFQDVGTYDADLVALYKNEVVEAKTDAGIVLALKDVKEKIEKLKGLWSTLCSSRVSSEEDGDDLSPIKKGRRKSASPTLSFQAVAEQTRDQFLAIRPNEEAMAISALVARWARDAFPTASAATSFSSTTSSANNTGGATVAGTPHWTLLKASYAFSLYHTTNFA
ncbi:MAG: hypothetical protein L6R39_001666, partial [Caloplaca ligustica]